MFSQFKLNSLKCKSGGERKKKANREANCCDSKKENTLSKRFSTWRVNEMVDESTSSKVTTVTICRDDGALGITLRGGLDGQELSCPFVITNVKPGGAAANEGTMRAGDRLLAVDGISLENLSLSEAQALLQKPASIASLTIEYDVKKNYLMENHQGPRLVEILRDQNQELGLTLHQTNHGIYIEHIKCGSIADRCGALQEGDRIKSINGRNDSSLGMDDVVQILEQPCLKLQLEVLSNDYGFSNICGTLRHQNTLQRTVTKEIYGSSVAITHEEHLNTTLHRQNGCFGIVLGENDDGSVIISGILPESAAERSQCLYPGDRVIKINHHNLAMENFSPDQAAALMMGDFLTIDTEFDVLDTVVPSNGVYTVKLLKRGNGGLGLTITGSSENGFSICDIKKGSLAHRAGSLLAGDRLLAINNITLDTCSSDNIAHILQHVDGLITLTVQRIQQLSNPKFLRKVVYTVDLQRYGGPLGITLAGSENATTPITVSALIPGGLAEQTGVLQVGDEILAVNEHNVQGQPLSTTEALLHSSPDLVALRISRTISQSNRPPDSTSPLLPPSIDSAVESWESSHLDLTLTPQESCDYVRMHPSALTQDSDIRDSCIIPDLKTMEMSTLPESREWYKALHLATDHCSSYLRSEFHDSHLINVKLVKDKVYDDFGFSVSDGLYERGVFINRIRKGGPADLSNLLLPYDRILQVNETCTQDFDCCLTVPLIASSGDNLSLLVSRSTKKSKPVEPHYNSKTCYGTNEKIIV